MAFFQGALLLTFSFASGFLTDNPALTSPYVFDPSFYVNTHADLHNIKTVEEAKHHWISTGINEGRQASGNFHSKQYLKRYSDLSKTYGTNYRGAVEHYVSNGLSENRLGYVEGGAEGRWTISSHDRKLFLSCSSRTAGAVDSLVWNHKEFINSWDHGRELQMASNTHPYGECFNPTEAGGRDDGGTDKSTSKLLHVKAAGSTLETTNHPAFWLKPGDKETMHISTPCGHDAPALTKDKNYNYDFSKTVTIGCAGLNNCVKFMSNMTVGGHWPGGYQEINFEAPTAYLVGDFHVIKTYDTKKKRLYDSYASNHIPVIFETQKGDYAMGVYAPTGQDTDAYQYYSAKTFGRSFTSGTNKWGVVFRKNAFSAGTHRVQHYVAYICVGTHTMVIDCLDKVYAHYPHV